MAVLAAIQCGECGVLARNRQLLGVLGRAEGEQELVKPVEGSEPVAVRLPAMAMCV